MMPSQAPVDAVVRGTDEAGDRADVDDLACLLPAADHGLGHNLGHRECAHHIHAEDL